MDCLAIILLFALNQYNPRENVKNKLDKWNNSNWQSSLYEPYKTIVKNDISVEINLNVVFCLNKLLQNC